MVGGGREESSALASSSVMMVTMPALIAEDEVAWNNDGHKISLRLNKAELEVAEIECPHEDDDEAPCRSDLGCVVSYFIAVYGLECNIGVCAPEEQMEICWCLQGNFGDVETGQLWFVPIKDEVFYAWMNQRPTDD